MLAVMVLLTSAWWEVCVCVYVCTVCMNMPVEERESDIVVIVQNENLTQ